MSGFSSLVLRRALSRLSRHQPREEKFKSALLMPLNSSGKINEYHPLDTDLAEYRRVVNEIIIPDCMEVANGLNGVPERIKTLISYTFPSFFDGFSVGVDLFYKTVAPQEEQTEENLTKMHMLRACVNLTFMMSGVLDDMADGSLVRIGKPCWHTICEGGQWVGMFDGVLLGYLPFHLLKKRFRDHPGYNHLMEAYAWATTQMVLGEILDLSCNKATPDIALQERITRFKTANFFAIQPVLGLVLAGIMEEKLFQEAKEIFSQICMLVQAWDDFCDYYCSEVSTGKPANDFKNGGTTWVSVTAAKHFNSRQREIFQELYGSGRAEDVEVTKQLLDELDLPRLYVGFLRDSYVKLKPLVASVSEPRLHQAFASYIQWLIGDVLQPLPEFGFGPLEHAHV